MSTVVRSWLTWNILLRFSKATGVLSRDKAITPAASGLTAVHTMTRMPAAPTIATRVTAALLVRLHKTTQEAPPARPRTARIDLLRTGCRRGLRGRTALDRKSQARNNMSTNPSHSTPPTPPPHTNSFQWRIAYQFTYFCQSRCSATPLLPSVYLSILSLCAPRFALVPCCLRWHRISDRSVSVLNVSCYTFLPKTDRIYLRLKS